MARKSGKYEKTIGRKEGRTLGRVNGAGAVLVGAPDDHF